MERFKPWKELVLALKSIADAIEGEDSKGDSGEVDNTNYIIPLNDAVGLVNKNLDASKLVFNIEERKHVNPKKVGDLFTQEGVDIINSMLSNEIIKTEAVSVFVFVKDTSGGDLLSPVVTLGFDSITNKYGILFKLNYAGYTSDKFTLDTPMSKDGLA